MRSAENSGVLESSRGASPYTLSLAVVPALLSLVSLQAPESPPQVPAAAISAAASDLGANVDSYFTLCSWDLAKRVAEADYHAPDIILALRPNRRYVVRGQIIPRNRTLGLAESDGDFDHLL